MQIRGARQPPCGIARGRRGNVFAQQRIFYHRSPSPAASGLRKSRDNQLVEHNAERVDIGSRVLGDWPARTSGAMYISVPVMVCSSGETVCVNPRLVMPSDLQSGGIEQ